MRLSLLFALAASVQAVFHHRQRSSTIVLNNVLYIDNGEIISWSKQGTGFVSNGSDLGDFSFLPDNNTYSIDLSTAWTNTSVTLNTIAKSAPVQVSGALWSDAKGQTFYAYDGGASYAIYDHLTHVQPTIVPHQLWQFTPSGLGGSWSQAEIAGNGTNLNRLMEITYGSGEGLGFALGGLRNPSTIPNTPATGETEAVHGMIVYNMTANTWQNISAGYDYSRGSLVGAGLYVPFFGPQGVFMAFGGITDQQSQIPFDNAFMYEPLSQAWAIQSVTGDKPPGSNNPCVVGVQGDNGTYEIFLYGGIQPATNGYRISDGSVYVLTLPAFHWQKTSSTVYGRYRHTCNVVGNRQMVSVGGIVIPGPLSNDSDFITGGPDPWPNGLGVFDMTDLVWKSSYQPDAKSYVSPDIVKSYYKSNGQYPSSWTSNTVQQWFTTDATVNNSSTTSSTSSSSAATGNSGSSNSSNGGNSSSTNLGAIIGGAVGGGVGLLIILVALFCLLRRRRRGRSREREQSTVESKAMMMEQDPDFRHTEQPKHDGHPAEVADGQVNELHSQSRPHEAADGAVNELHSQPRPYEAADGALNELHPHSRPHEAANGQLYELDSRSRPYEADSRPRHELGGYR